MNTSEEPNHFGSTVIPHDDFTDGDVEASESGCASKVTANGDSDLLKVMRDLSLYEIGGVEDELTKERDADGHNEHLAEIRKKRINSKDKNVDLRLTERTNKILSDYREYVIQIQKDLGEVTHGGSHGLFSIEEDDDGETKERGEHRFRDERRKSGSSVGLSREWAHEFHYAAFGQGGECVGYQHPGHGEVWMKRRGYRFSNLPPIFHSKLFRAAVLIVLVAGVVIGVIIRSVTPANGNNVLQHGGEDSPVHETPDSEIHLPPKVIEGLQNPAVQSTGNKEQMGEQETESSSAVNVDTSKQGTNNKDLQYEEEEKQVHNQLSDRKSVV